MAFWSPADMVQRLQDTEPERRRDTAPSPSTSGTKDLSDPQDETDTTTYVSDIDSPDSDIDYNGREVHYDEFRHERRVQLSLSRKLQQAEKERDMVLASCKPRRSRRLKERAALDQRQANTNHRQSLRGSWSQVTRSLILEPNDKHWEKVPSLAETVEDYDRRYHRRRQREKQQRQVLERLREKILNRHAAASRERLRRLLEQEAEERRQSAAEWKVRLGLKKDQKRMHRERRRHRTRREAEQEEQRIVAQEEQEREQEEIRARDRERLI